MIMIKSLYGRWRGEDLKGLTERIILGIRVLINETSERIVYSEPTPYLFGVTDEIGADPGEAICFVNPGDDFSFVAVGRMPHLTRWVDYYFFDPHMTRAVAIKGDNITVCGVPVTQRVIESYKPFVKKTLLFVLKSKAATTHQERLMVEKLLSPP